VSIGQPLQALLMWAARFGEGEHAEL